MSARNHFTPAGRLVAVGLIFLTAYGHWALAAKSGGPKVFGFEALTFFWDQVVSRPVVLFDVGRQLAVMLLLYGLAFWGVFRLARRGASRDRWFEKDVVTLPATWIACSWLVLVLHNTYFPRSVWAYLLDPHAVASAGAGSLLALAWLAWRLKIRLQGSQFSRRTALVGVLIPATTLLLYACTFVVQHLHAAGSRKGDDRINIVMIGLDSMRRDLALTATEAELPNLYAFRQSAFIQSNVIAPLARTYPSWVTILTGRQPRETQVRDNLVPLTDAARTASFAHVLRDAGYRTIYATDETRFSNIGPEMGFDQVPSPKPGISDFFLGEIGDSPLVNLAVQLPYMEWLLPSLVGNRAFAHAYYPSRFLERLTRAIGPATSQPTFLAVHLCTAHWPFYTAALKELPRVRDANYSESVRSMDDQFGHLLQRLRNLGYVDDRTLVVVLADHGEGLSGDLVARPTIERHGVTGRFGVVGRGHGGSLLVPAQWQVFTMFSGTTKAGPLPPGTSAQLASLEDVRGAVLEMAGLPADAPHRLDVVGRTGVPAPSASAERRYVAVETGFAAAGLDLGDPDRAKAAEIGRTAFMVDDHARVLLRPEAYAQSVAERDLGVVDDHRGLITELREGALHVVSADFDANRWRVFTASPPADLDLRSVPLLDAACGEAELRRRLGAWCSVYSSPSTGETVSLRGAQ